MQCDVGSPSRAASAESMKSSAPSISSTIVYDTDGFPAMGREKLSDEPPENDGDGHVDEVEVPADDEMQPIAARTQARVFATKSARQAAKKKAKSDKQAAKQEAKSRKPADKALDKLPLESLQLACSLLPKPRAEICGKVLVKGVKTRIFIYTFTLQKHGAKYRTLAQKVVDSFDVGKLTKSNLLRQISLA